MGDPLQSVSPGDPLPQSAATYNAVFDAARKVRAGGRSWPGGAANGWGGAVVALAVNDTGADLDEFKPVGLGDSVGGTDLDEDGLDWTRRPLVSAVLPAGEDGSVAVTLEPIADGQIGRVAVGGLCLCDVAVTNSLHGFAVPAAGDANRLFSASAGPVRIVHVPAGAADTKRCAVLLNAAGAAGGGGGGTADGGFDQFCLDSGVLKRREDRSDGSFRCVPVDACCPVAWWCLSNSWLELAADCCSPAPFRVTQVVQVTFTNKLGAATELPDVAYWTYDSALAGDAVFRGRTDGTLTFSCVGSDIVAALDGGFSGGTPATAPCDLTGTVLDLGTWAYRRVVAVGCGATGEEWGLVDVTVEPVEDGFGDPISGVVSLGENVSPAPNPWMTGPYRTQIEADKCCTFLALCSGQPFTHPRRLTLSLEAPTGVFTATSVTLDLDEDGGYIATCGLEAISLQLAVDLGAGTGFLVDVQYRVQMGVPTVLGVPTPAYQRTVRVYLSSATVSVAADFTGDGDFTTPGFFSPPAAGVSVTDETGGPVLYASPYGAYLGTDTRVGGKLRVGRLTAYVAGPAVGTVDVYIQ